MPGLVINQAASMDPYSGLWGGIGTQEGKGVENTILLFGTESGDAYNKLAVHEISHGFYLQHAPGGGATECSPALFLFWTVTGSRTTPSPSGHS